MQKEEEACDVSTLKACIMSRKGGVPLTELNGDYRELVGSDIPFKRLGHSNLREYLQMVDGVTVRAGMVYCSCPETQHIEAMISKQRSKTLLLHRPCTNKKTDGKKRRKRKMHLEREHSNPKQFIPNGYQNNPQPQPLSSSVLQWSDNILNNKMPVPSLSNREYELIFNDNNQLHNLAISVCKLLLVANIDIPAALRRLPGSLPWLGAVPGYYGGNGRREGRNPFVLYGHQVVGDDCMVKLGLNNFSQSVSLDSFLDTCVVGLTLAEAQQRVVRHGCLGNVLILCGAIDIHRGTPMWKIIGDMQNLLVSVLLSGGDPVVCQLPPSPFLWLNHNIAVFNYWLSTLSNVCLIDLYTPFCNYHSFHRSYFQGNTISVEGTMYFLWTREGEKAVIRTLSQELCLNGRGC